MEQQPTSEQKRSQSLWSRIIFFFPFRLLILHIKKNHLLMIFWLLLFGYVSGVMASKYGVNYLFLYPEYLGKVGFWSHFLIGFALGGFVMAFNIYTYVIHAFRFRFLATLSRPFFKFSINNFVLPGIFIFYYIWKVVEFQRKIEFESATGILTNVLGFLVGFTLFLGVSLLYFYGTNKDILGFLKPANKESKRAGRFSQLYDRFLKERLMQSQKDWKQRPWRVESYLRHPFSVAIARESEHYDIATLRKVFKQNHFNASLFEILLVLTFFLVMNFGDLPVFTIPGGASVILFFTLLLMIISILLSWFRGWAVTVLLLLVLVANSYSSDLSFLPQTNGLYGLNYKVPPAAYNADVLTDMTADEQVITRDRQQMETVLSRWKAKQPGEGKPKLLLINCSGGGLRSSLWTTSVMTELDSLLAGNLMDRTALITGASGGMIGATYVRERFIQNGYQDIYRDAVSMKEDISKDVLNPILLSIASSDVFFQMSDFEYGGHSYPKDRAYRFEEQLLDNTGRGLDKSLFDYRTQEGLAQIPMVILYPTIINDGRKMLVSPLDISFMCELPGVDNRTVQHQHELVEYRKLLADQGADESRYISLVRASSTFPYILPQVTLPTEPPIQLMDAGIRDNFGASISYRYIAAMREWIEENTSGVILVQLRDQRKDIADSENSQQLLSRLTSPLGNVYGNFMKSQDFASDELYASTSAWLQVPIDLINIQLEQPGEKNVSMSWHLTALEKSVIAKSLKSAENQAAMNRVTSLLDSSNR